VHCDGALNCTLSPTATASLAAGTYTWKVQDSGAYGAGNWSAPQTFTLGACYSLTTAVSPSERHGHAIGLELPALTEITKLVRPVNTDRCTCFWIYLQQLERECQWHGQPGFGGHVWQQVSDCQLQSPPGDPGWIRRLNNIFSWTGVNGATQYRLNVTGTTTIINAFFTVGAGVGQVHCDGALELHAITCSNGESGERELYLEGTG